jgi:O-antigen ligase
MTRNAWAVPFVLLVFILPFPGTVALRLLCLAAAFGTAVWRWRQSDPPPLPGKLAIGAWALLAAASVAYSFDPAYSLSEFKNEIGYALMAYIAFFVCVRGEPELRLVLLGLFGATVVVCVWGLGASAVAGVWPENGAHGGSGTASVLFVSAAPLAGVAAFARRDRRSVQSVALLLVLICIASTVTRQRILWPIFIVQLVVATVLLKRAAFLAVSWRRLACLLALASIVAGAALGGMQAWRAHTGQLKAVDPRQAAWPAVTKRIAEHPWKGAGFGRQAMRKAYPDLVPDEETLFWHAHNVFLNAGISMGVPGALALLLVFGSLAWSYGLLLRAPDERARLIGVAGLLLLIGVVGRNLTNDYFVRDGSLLFWALNGSLLGAGLRLQPRRAEQPAPMVAA